MMDIVTITDVVEFLLWCIVIGVAAGLLYGSLERLAGWRRR